MRFPYRRLETRTPVTSLGGLRYRYKPIIRVELALAGMSHCVHALVRSLPLLGHAGFLQFFTAEFRGDTHEVLLTPNDTFPGTLT